MQTDPVEFTAREQIVLNYLKDPQLSSPWRASFLDLVIVTVSVICTAVFLAFDAPASSFIGYALVLGRLIHVISFNWQWTRVYASIFAKYDAKVRELSERAGTAT
jgi:hypothetical protein